MHDDDAQAVCSDDLEADLGERNDLAQQEPEILASMVANLTAWWESVRHSIAAESKCPNDPTTGHGRPSRSIPVRPSILSHPAGCYLKVLAVSCPQGPYPSSDECSWLQDTQLGGGEHWVANTTTREECCGVCRATKGCNSAHFSGDSCNLWSSDARKPGKGIACIPLSDAW